MKNPKTTITGLVVVAGAVFTLVGHLISGGLVMADVTALITALVGVGLVMAKDGGK